MTVELIGGLKTYPWGSTTAIQELCSLPIDGEPLAEVWFGAHPSAPSLLSTGQSLQAAIEIDPVSEVGTQEPALHYLVKLLAAEEALSIQLHPDTAAAAAGFERETHAGIAIDDPSRSFRDASHKPEVVYPLTQFEVLAGLQNADQMRATIAELSLQPQMIDVLETSGPKGLLKSILATPVPEWALDSLDSIACLDPSSVRQERRAHVEALLDIAKRRPHDPGLVVAALMHYRSLAPGEAMFVDANCLHAYLSGTAVEVMACSDNVIRGGLTDKFIDIDELVRLIDVDRQPELVTNAPDGQPLPIAVEEFELVHLGNEVDNGFPLPAGVPHIVLCLDDQITVADGSVELVVTAGRAAWVRASQEAIITGPGRSIVVGGKQS